MPDALAPYLALIRPRAPRPSGVAPAKKRGVGCGCKHKGVGAPDPNANTIEDEFVWPTWAERVLERKVAARNLRLLLEDLDRIDTFESLRDAMLIRIEEARLTLLLVGERLRNGAPPGTLLLNFVHLQRDNLLTSLSSASAVHYWFKKALAKANEDQTRELATTGMKAAAGYTDELPGVIVLLTDTAVAAGIQLERIASKDRGMWGDLLEEFRRRMPKPPEVPWLLIVAAVVAGAALTNR